MRYFRSLSHASTLDSLSSSFMCNVVNEANTVVPPPYSCDDSVDELSAVESCERREPVDVGSIVSLTNHRTTSDVSSLAAQSPCSPPRATSPTIEVRLLTVRFVVLDRPTDRFAVSVVCRCATRDPLDLETESAFPPRIHPCFSSLSPFLAVPSLEKERDLKRKRNETTKGKGNGSGSNDFPRSSSCSCDNCWTRYSSFLICLTGTPPLCLASPRAAAPSCA